MSTLLVRLVPAGLGVVLGLVVAVAGQNGTFVVRTPLVTVLVVAGVLVSAVLLGLGALLRRWRSSRAEGRADGVRAEREAHRRFLARLDHELKNPVTAIRSAIAAEPAADSSPHLRVAAAQAERLGALVGELRGLAALESRPIERVPVDLASLASEELSVLRDELASRGTHRDITVTFPTAPWPLPAVAGDADLLAVAIRNLLVNAAKYSGTGERIEVRGWEEDGSVLLEVADSGRGIRAEELPHVWDELWRSPDARGVEGTGLGLSLVRVVAERHGGEASIRSEPGRGTSVRLRIPVSHNRM